MFKESGFGRFFCACNINLKEKSYSPQRAQRKAKPIKPKAWYAAGFNPFIFIALSV
ncbi:MAG: hypothetical protein V7765_01605 [Oleispira sp.]